MTDLQITEAFLYMDYLCFRALCCKGPPPARAEYDLVCIGLTGAGKTSLLSKLCSESPDNVVSTTGFSIKAVPFQNAILNVKELGGADNIRKYWSRYYQGSQGVIFVLDSASSEDDLETARNELHSALQHPQLCTLPFLILANHQDKPAARSVQEWSLLLLLKSCPCGLSAPVRQVSVILFATAAPNTETELATGSMPNFLLWPDD
ncbi:ADP-ribosylation factor-like protein 15 isoform X5 [Rhinolophus ferrumequinum]|uniref:ADP-ribosylation factor-like protein 15 isoform X5 n=1 Tax=Rhinolophus ferrumequinum TaxID=59479 RepID=UPI00140F9CD3|nr:ADP-ribosylation factor-like protein 15 isoform X5 [Rhinolophus ferrumequinum]